MVIFVSLVGWLPRSLSTATLQVVNIDVVLSGILEHRVVEPVVTVSVPTVGLAAPGTSTTAPSVIVVDDDDDQAVTDGDALAKVAVGVVPGGEMVTVVVADDGS